MRRFKDQDVKFGFSRFEHTFLFGQREHTFRHSNIPPQMPQPGGPAAINGFLFQFLQHLGRIAEVKISGELIDADLTGDACLILEPSNGGDARIESDGQYIVEQYKVRTGRTWSTNTIIDKVLMDLRKSITNPPRSMARYRFVTDGHEGKLEKFKEFLLCVRSAAGPDDLDNEQCHDFGGDEPLTHQEFLSHIMGATRFTPSAAGTDERAAVFHLLARFEMEFNADSATLVSRVEQILKRYVPNLGDERATRERLVGVLMERLAIGEVRLDTTGIDDLFRHVGLNPERARNATRLADVMAKLAVERLNRMRYRVSDDIRSAPLWPPQKSILLLVGDSGYGKTWLLAKLVITLHESREVAVIRRVVGAAKEELQGVSDDVWQTGLGNTNRKTLQALHLHYQELAPTSTLPWLTIALDDVQDLATAKALVQEDWSRLGIRIAMTVPTSIGRSLAASDEDLVHVHEVSRFSVDELDQFLTRKGRLWSDLPGDLRELLRTPVLAGIYTELSTSSFQTAPNSEYEIFEGFWKRISERGRTGDGGILNALGARVLHGLTYPLSRAAWAEIGALTEEPIARLQAVGWLQCDECGLVSFAHDRLLNWAVARHLAQQVETDQLSANHLGEKLSSFLASFDPLEFRRLGYVPMDLLWQLASDSKKTTFVREVVQSLIQTRAYGSYGEDLIVEQLPSMGVRAVPILLNLLDTFPIDTNVDYRIGLIAKAIAAIAIQEKVDLSEVIDCLMASSSKGRQAVAIAALTAAPASRYLDRLWRLHQPRCVALADHEAEFSSLDYRASNAALQACVELAPRWLKARILNADKDTERVSELGYLLYNLEHGDATQIWIEAGKVLMEKMETNKPRSLLHCIGRFRDLSQIDFVVDCLARSDDWASSSALGVLALLDADRAISDLGEVDQLERCLSRNNWLPALLLSRREEVRAQILKLAKAESNGRRLVEQLFAERPNEMGAEMFSWYLRRLEEALGEQLKDTTSVEPGWLYRTLDFLEGVTHPDLLDALEDEKDSDLEATISTIACRRLAHQTRSRDPILVGSMRLLTLIGGKGIERLLLAQLESENFWARRVGIDRSYRYPDIPLLRQLHKIAQTLIPVEGDNANISQAQQDNYAALVALAALKADSELIDAIWNGNEPYIPSELVTMRDSRRPMSKAATAQALAVLQNKCFTDDAQIMKALKVALISADADFISPVQMVLSQADPNCLTARYACIALTQLGDQSPEFSAMARSMLAAPENRPWAMEALIGTRSSGLQSLVAYLQTRAVSIWDHADEELIGHLHTQPETRAFAVESAVRFCLERSSINPPYDIAWESNDATLRSMIVSDAFASNSGRSSISLHAIEGLANIDPVRALKAAEIGLRIGGGNDGHLCNLIARLSPIESVEILISAATETVRGTLRAAVGRILRQLDPVTVDLLLFGRMHDEAQQVRAVGVELAGWLSNDRLSEPLRGLASSDPVWAVRTAAFAAIDRKKNEKIVSSLFEKIKQSTGNRRWAILSVILEVGDPFLISHRNDILWLGNILDDLPIAFFQYAMAVIHARKQKEN